MEPRPIPAPSVANGERRNRFQEDTRRQIRSLRRTLAAVGFVSCAALILSLYLLLRPAMTARAFEMRDAEGRLRARLGMNDYFPELVFFDESGAKKGAFDISGLYLRGDFGSTLLRELDHASILEFRRGQTRTRLVNQGDSMFLKFLDHDAQRSTVDLSLKEGGAARLYVYDPDHGVFVAPRKGSRTAPPRRTDGSPPEEEPEEDPDRSDRR
jgi:hypothetical protein